MSIELGDAVLNWTAPCVPDFAYLEGKYCRLEKLDAAKHSAQLWQHYKGHDEIWDYMFSGPFPSKKVFFESIVENSQSVDPMYFAIKNKDAEAYQGMCSYLRIAPASGSIEVGNISYSPSLQKSRAATEAMYLLMQWAFDAGYRRFEWKCNALNIPSRAAAQRLGFSYEGIFRQALIVKGHNRDTAWFAMIDKEWPQLRAAFSKWLNPDNFNRSGRQIQSLKQMTQSILAAKDPSL